jgi:hypothetical protein
MKSKDDEDLISYKVGSAYQSVTNTSILDPYYVRSALDRAIDVGRYDPLAGISSAVSIGSAVSNLLNSSSGILSSEAFASKNLFNSISALGELARPYDQLSGLASSAPYISSITSLASASALALTIKGLDGLTHAGLSSGISNAGLVSAVNGATDWSVNAAGLNVHSPVFSLSTPTLAQELAPTMLASTRAVLGLDNAYARLSKADIFTDALSNLPVTTVPSYITTLHEGINSLSSAAKTAWDNIALRPEALTAASLYIVRAPSVEIYTASQAAASISLPVNEFPQLENDIEEIIDETFDEFEVRLSGLNPALWEMYRGAVITMERGGPDWQRQTMVSFRELTTHVLHLLAPDKSLKSWAKQEHFANGKLTRRARLEYIFESVGEGEFTNFFKADLKASLELFDLLNNGTHRLTSSATPEQLRYLRGRVVNLLSAMLEASGH